MRYRAAGVRDGLRGAGRKGRTLYYQRASCDCLRWLVRYPVCHLRQRLCQHGSQYAGNGGDSDFYLYQLYRLGRYHAADGLRRLQGPQVAQLHRRAASGHRLPVRSHCRYRHK